MKRPRSSSPQNSPRNAATSIFYSPPLKQKRHSLSGFYRKDGNTCTASPIMAPPKVKRRLSRENSSHGAKEMQENIIPLPRRISASFHGENHAISPSHHSSRKSPRQKPRIQKKLVHIDIKEQFTNLRDFFKHHSGNNSNALRPISQNLTQSHRSASREEEVHYTLVLHDKRHDEGSKTLVISMNNITIISLEGYHRLGRSEGTPVTPGKFLPTPMKTSSPPSEHAPYISPSKAFSAYSTINASKILVRGENIQFKYLNLQCSCLKIKANNCAIENCLIKGCLSIKTPSNNSILPRPSASPLSPIKLHSQRPPTIKIVNSNLSSAEGIALLINSPQSVEVSHCIIHDSCHSNVVVRGSAHLAMHHCDVSRAHQAGIWFKENSTGLVEHCEIHHNMLPNLCISADSQAIIQHCDIHSSEQNGVSARDAAGGHLKHCKLHNNSYPNLYVTGCSDLSVEECEVYCGSLGGIWVKESASPKIFNCKIHSNCFHNVLLSGEARAHIDTCEICNGSQKGVLFKERASSTLNENEIHSHTQSNIELQDASNPLIKRNKISKSFQCGIYIHGNARGRFEHNDIYDNEHSNVFSCDESSPTFFGNEIHSGKQSGVCCKNQSTASFEENSIHNNQYFNVKLSDYTKCRLIRNRIYESKKAGICVRGCAQGVIRNNELFRNSDENILIEEMLTAAPEVSDNILH